MLCVCVCACVYTEVFGWCSFLLFWFDFLPLLLSYSLLRMFILYICKCVFVYWQMCITYTNSHIYKCIYLVHIYRIFSLFLSLFIRSRHYFCFFFSVFLFVCLDIFFSCSVFFQFSLFSLCLSQCPWFHTIDKYHHYFTKSTGYFVVYYNLFSYCCCYYAFILYRYVCMCDVCFGTRACIAV